MAKVPLLFVSDAISCPSGLGRITRDLAVRVHEHLGDIYRVATAGYGGSGSILYPFPQYHFHSIDQWLLPDLPDIADDFAQGDPLTILYVWDASRLYWVGKPSMCPIPRLRRFAERTDVRKWIYGAIDAEGPNGTLPSAIAETYKGFDRVLDYSAFSAKITGHSDWLPHGIDTAVFQPHPKQEARQKLIDGGFMGLTQDSFLIGVVATNQARKNWPLAFQTARLLVDRGIDVRVWAHTDAIDRYWSFGNMIMDYGLRGRVAVTTNRYSDAELAWMYSACDCTLGVAPEGFGLPIAESLACGVPCFVGSYGAQAEFVPKSFQIEPTDYYYDGAFCSKRPVHNPERWARKIAAWAKERTGVELPERVDWNGPTLLPAWLRWFREGAQ